MNKALFSPFTMLVIGIFALTADNVSWTVIFFLYEPPPDGLSSRDYVGQK